MTPYCSVALRPSRALAAALGGAHGLALASALASLSGPPLLLVGAGVVLSGLWCVADALLRLPGSVVRFDIAEDGTGVWLDRSGRRYPVRQARATWVSSGLVILGLSTGRWRTRWLVLLRDSTDAEALRKLRVWVKWRPEGR